MTDPIYKTDALIAEDIEAYLDQHQNKSMLRFITCGSVDDGKSTLIGRLLYDSKMIFEDQLAALENDSKRVGTQGQEIDFALLVDGLAAEREQGITIDVAYRFFATEKRKFIVADCPGHEQYTRNMVTGASTADCAVILTDARKGILTQTRRHTYICTLPGIRHLVLAINKMDLVDYSEQVFEETEAAYKELAKSPGAEDVTCIPVSALEGENVTTASDKMLWYDGQSLMQVPRRCPSTTRHDRPFHARAVGQLAQRGLPRLGLHPERRGPRRRRDHRQPRASRARLGIHGPTGSNRAPAVRDALLRRRDRREPRRHHRPAGGRPEVR